MAKRACAHDIRVLLRARYPGPEWVLAEEVRNAAGFDAGRSADAIALSVWPSRGLVVHGFEIKVDRGDWKRELADPEKADAIAKYCDHWWIAAARDVVPLDELPANWGLMEAHGHGEGWRLKVIKPAPKLAAKDWDRTFLAAFVARVARTEEAEIKLRVAKEMERLDEERREGFERRVAEAAGNAARRGDRLEKMIKDFEEASGVSLGDRRYDGLGNAKEVGAAVRVVLRSGALRTYDGLADVANQMERHAESIRAALRELEECTSEAEAVGG